MNTTTPKPDPLRLRMDEDILRHTEAGLVHYYCVDVWETLKNVHQFETQEHYIQHNSISNHSATVRIRRESCLETDTLA